MGFKADAAVNFNGSFVEYSFLGNPSNEYIQEIPVIIIGDTVNYDRHFKAEVVRDTSTTASDSQYEIIGGIVKAGEFTGTLSIKLRNSPELSTSSVSVKVKLIDSEDMKAGNVEANQYIVRWTNKIIIPSWTYYRVFFCSVSSTAVYRLIVQTTGLKTFPASQYVALGTAGAQALGTQFGDYVKQWNKDHPNDHLKHDDGTRAGQDIVPVYYTRSKFD